MCVSTLRNVHNLLTNSSIIQYSHDLLLCILYARSRRLLSKKRTSDVYNITFQINVVNSYLSFGEETPTNSILSSPKMYREKKSNILYSTPVRNSSVNVTPLSISDVKPSTSGSTPQSSAICDRRPSKKSVYRKEERKRKRKCRKRKGVAPKNKGRKQQKPETSDDEWEVVSVDENFDNQNINIPGIFQSPERTRDVGFNTNKDFVLSPSLIQRGAIVLGVDDEVANKEDEVWFLDVDEVEDKVEDKVENKVEECHEDSSPIFVREKFVKTYPPKKDDSLRLKGIGYLLVNPALTNAYSNLLWDRFLEDNVDEFPEHYKYNMKRKFSSRNDSRNDRNNISSDTDSANIFSVPDKKRRKLFKSKKLETFANKGRQQKIKDPEIVYLTDDELFTKLEEPAEKRRKRSHKKYISSANITDDLNIQKPSGKQMTFNEFHAKCRKEKEKDTNCSTRKTSNAKVKSIVSLKFDVHRRSDGNYIITKL